MCYIVTALKKLLIKVRLQVRFKPLFCCAVSFILIGIDNINLRVAIQNLRTFIKGVRSDKIIMITQHYIITLCYRKCLISIGGYSERPLQISHISDTLILSSILSYYLPQSAAIFTSVRETELPVRIGLPADCFDEFIEESFLCFIQRNKYTEFRHIFKSP